MDEKGNQAVNEAAARARSAAEAVAARATDVVGAAKGAVHDAIDSMAQRANAASDWTGNKVDNALNAPRDVARIGADYLRQRPYASLLIAAGIAYLIGRMSRR